MITADNSAYFERIFDKQDQAFQYADLAFQDVPAWLDRITDAASHATDPNAVLKDVKLDDGDLKDKIWQILNYMPSGIPDDVWQQIGDETRERVNASMNANIAEMDRRFSASGWELPIGMYVEAVNQATQAAALENSANAREIAKQRAQMERDGVFQTIQSELQRVIADGNITVEKFRMALAAMQTNVGFLVDAAKSGAQIKSQIAASALSLINMNASGSASFGISASNSYSESKSLNQ